MHPTVQRELSRQQDALTQLRALKTVGEADLLGLRSGYRKQADDFFDAKN